MRNWIWMLAIAITLMFGTALNAQEGKEGEKPAKEGEGEKEGEKEKEEADPIETLKKQFKDIDTVIGSVTITQADLDSYKKYEKEFDDFAESDAKLEELSEKSLKEAFDYAVKSEKYLEWAAKRELKAEDWLRKALRIVVLGIREQFNGPEYDEQIESMREMKKEIEKMKDQLPEEDFKESMKQMDEAIAQLESLRDFGKSLPAPTEAEAALLKKANEGGSDDEEGEKEDSMD